MHMTNAIRWSCLSFRSASFEASLIPLPLLLDGLQLLQPRPQLRDLQQLLLQILLLLLQRQPLLRVQLRTRLSALGLT